MRAAWSSFIAIFLRFQMPRSVPLKNTNITRSNPVKDHQQWLRRVDSVTFLSTTRQLKPTFWNLLLFNGLSADQAGISTWRISIAVAHCTADATSDALQCSSKKRFPCCSFTNCIKYSRLRLQNLMWVSAFIDFRPCETPVQPPIFSGCWYWNKGSR